MVTAPTLTLCALKSKMKEISGSTNEVVMFVYNDSPDQIGAHMTHYESIVGKEVKKFRLLLRNFWIRNLNFLLSLFISLCVCVCLSVSLSLWLSVSLSVSLFLSLSVCLQFCLIFFFSPLFVVFVIVDQVGLNARMFDAVSHGPLVRGVVPTPLRDVVKDAEMEVFFPDGHM